MSEKRTPKRDTGPDSGPGAARWPFDPMQPGDHEPVRLPEEIERLQKPEEKELKP